MDVPESLQKVIRWVMRDTLYLGRFASTVQQQNGDDTVDILPDDERVRGNGTQNVKILHGLPGVTVRVRQGARVELGFENGDPARPFVALWEPGSLESISFDGGTRPVARKGDPVVIYWPPGFMIQGVLGALPFSGAVTISTPSAGIIDGGKDNVTA
jgi:hypothetical protein